MTQGVCEAGCNQEEGSRQERGVHDRGRGNGVGGRNWGRDGTGRQMRSKCEYSLLKFSIYLHQSSGSYIVKRFCRSLQDIKKFHSELQPLFLEGIFMQNYILT